MQPLRHMYPQLYGDDAFATQSEETPLSDTTDIDLPAILQGERQWPRALEQAQPKRTRQCPHMRILRALRSTSSSPEPSRIMPKNYRMEPPPKVRGWGTYLRWIRRMHPDREYVHYTLHGLRSEPVTMESILTKGYGAEDKDKDQVRWETWKTKAVLRCLRNDRVMMMRGRTEKSVLTCWRLRYLMRIILLRMHEDGDSDLLPEEKDHLDWKKEHDAKEAEMDDWDNEETFGREDEEVDGWESNETDGQEDDEMLDQGIDWSSSVEL